MADLFKNSFISNQSLEDLVLSMPMPAHVKDAVTGKYITSNKKNIEVYGLNKVEEIIGRTVGDLDHFMRPYWGDGFAQRIIDADLVVKEKNKILKIQNCLLVAKNGFIHVQDMTKIPTVNDVNSVAAIFTYTHDKTSKVNLVSLLHLYEHIYKKPHEASENFCKYLNISNFFSKPPSHAELLLLLYAKDYGSRRDIAQKMCRSIKTVETHITHINNKLKTGDFLKIVNMIRSFARSKLIIAGEYL